MNKHVRYLWYLLKHKWFVFLYGLQYRAPIWKLFIHDWSKFLPSEWNGYVEWFYGNKDERAFNAAWNHHQKVNPHHWQYWILILDAGDIKALPMPDTYRREMIADWCGASHAITGMNETSEWYKKNKDHIVLHEETRRWIEEQLYGN